MVAHSRFIRSQILKILSIRIFSVAALAVLPAIMIGLPGGRLDDGAFWQIVSGFSEPEGPSEGGENFVSNERLFQTVLPEVQKHSASGGVYLGVGPEQNFTFIAAVRPRLAFIVDIRRQNMLEHLMYKVLFEVSEDRAEFLSYLFSRKRPDTARTNSSAEALFDAYDRVPPDQNLFDRNLLLIENSLLQRHGFNLSPADIAKIEHVYRMFFIRGPDLNFIGTETVPPAVDFPAYQKLMTQTDSRGKNRSFLASEKDFQVVRNLEGRNLLIPVVGDFSGPKTLRTIGKFLSDRGEAVSTVYASNVEQYLFETDKWKAYYANLAAIPMKSSSTFIRSVGVSSYAVTMGGPDLTTVMLTDSLAHMLSAFKAGQIATYADVIRMSRCGRPDFAKYGCQP